jgi:hypothetical protein
MKRWLFLIVMYWCAWTACAQARARPDFPKTSTPTIANFGPGCRIQVAQPSASRFDITYARESGWGGGMFVLNDLKFLPGEWFFGLVCYAASAGHVREGWAVPSSSGGWALRKSESSEQLLPLRALRFYELTAKNSRGWAVAVDDISGDERFRQRELSYCLIRDSKAVCGGGYMGYLRDFQRHKDADLTPRILDLLRNVEFLEDAPPSSLAEPARPTR